MTDDVSSHTDTDYVEPCVTSNDPNERKLARRLRIDRRWEAIRRQGTSEMLVEEEAPNPVQIQVQKSADLLARFVYEGEEYVTNVRVANDGREVDRRDEEGINREKVIEQLENEAAQAEKAFEVIAEKWAVIQNYNDPLHINEDIMEQKEKCELVIKQKDGIIAMLKEEIRKADRKFDADQDRQIQDIDTLSRRIEKQMTFMRSAFHKEFELIEGAILMERQILIDTSNRKWEELHKKRDEQEVDNSDNKFDLLNEFYDNMKEKRTLFQEKYRNTKITLENDIDTLQKELERIKALALLNSEKLDYNYQVLKKREDENIIIKSQQKRRINKLQDIINTLRKKIADYETSTNNEIKRIRERIKKLHRNILEVEAKADLFAKINDEKFHQVWDMNKKMCENILKQIMDTDKILYEQQLGIAWDPPVYRISNVPSHQKESGQFSGRGSNSSLSSNKGKKNEETQIEMVRTSLSTKLRDRNPLYKRLVTHVLKHISDKSGFLTENKLRSVLRPYEDEQKTLIRLDNVFESLRVDKKEDIDALVNFFVPYAYCAKCSATPELAPQMSVVVSRYTPSQLSTLSTVFSKTELDKVDCSDLEDAFNAIQQPMDRIEDIVTELVIAESSSSEEGPGSDEHSVVCGEATVQNNYTTLKEKKGAGKKTYITEDKMLCQYNHHLVISSIYVLKALRDFVLSFYAEKEGLPTTRERLERKRLTASRMLQESDIQSYWEQFTKIYNEDRIRVWDGLLAGLKKYHAILKDRKALCEEVITLRQQNQDFKRLLANYIQDADVMDPPCAIEQKKCLSTIAPSYTNAKK